MGLEQWNGALVRWGDTAKIAPAPDRLFWAQEASSELFWSQVLWTRLSLRIHSVANVGEADRYWQGGGERELKRKGEGRGERGVWEGNTWRARMSL